ncbi:hypothetical protein [Porphyromonas macacae]|nr:hypothetical protein [Porphyromonas macacae]
MAFLEKPIQEYLEVLVYGKIKEVRDLELKPFIFRKNNLLKGHYEEKGA